MPKQSPIFADGMRFFNPSENAPEWVKGNILINAEQFINFLQNNKREDGTVRLNLKKSKDKGTLYFQLDTYVSKQEKELPVINVGEPTETQPPASVEEIVEEYRGRETDAVYPPEGF